MITIHLESVYTRACVWLDTKMFVVGLNLIKMSRSSFIGLDVVPPYEIVFTFTSLCLRRENDKAKILTTTCNRCKVDVSPKRGVSVAVIKTWRFLTLPSRLLMAVVTQHWQRRRISCWRPCNTLSWTHIRANSACFFTAVLAFRQSEPQNTNPQALHRALLNYNLRQQTWLSRFRQPWHPSL